MCSQERRAATPYAGETRATTMDFDQLRASIAELQRWCGRSTNATGLDQFVTKESPHD
jgi:hypothetical protein